MVASKTAKSNSFLAHRPSDDPCTRKNVVSRIFKVFTETQKLQVDADTKKPVVGFRRDAALTRANASKKVALKNAENCKGKSVNSVPNAGRNPLADVSNVARQASKYTNLGRVPVAQSSRTANVSLRKPLMGKVRDSQGVCEYPTLGRGNTNNLKAPSEDQGREAKCSGHEYTFASSRNTTRNPHIARKSLPVLRRVSKTETSTAKKIEERSEETKGKVKTKAVPQTRSTLWRNRASDSFITSGRSQTGIGASTSSRKSIKPVVKTKLKSSIPQRVPKPKCASSLNKAEAVTSLPKKAISVAPTEATQGDLPSDDQSTSVAKRKSNRRRSYTSSLIAGSKVRAGKLLELLLALNVWLLQAQNPLLANYSQFRRILHLKCEAYWSTGLLKYTSSLI